MESRFRVLFLVLPMIALTLSGCAATKSLFGRGDKSAPPPAELPQGQVIEPEVERRKVKEPKIDTEDFEIGAFVGVLSIEDFGSDFVYGARIAYHVTEGFFVEGTAGQTKAGLTSFEILSGGAPLLSDSDRQYTYYNLNLGYNILPGEVFIGEGRAYNNALYLIGGLGSTRFAGDDRFTVNFGVGYRFLFNDSVAFHFDFRDHLYDIDLLGEEKTTHNLEAHVGVTMFF
ncbi:MAG: outer membrane beta-barrel domain-containing protein [Gammaproteobacteria bacterium]|nr:outer membrane beta-barrel domain-containing protein [Gammaproteobacteria bacterium]MDH4313631.1 outer membrane beta-barrel domain-containing protein [Gammaproteobacteria bacterium]MDH5213844.1 outer membrane beta-barrel domain-containing protein [Gammaproteobacteria bacterium]